MQRDTAIVMLLTPKHHKIVGLTWELSIHMPWLWRVVCKKLCGLCRQCMNDGPRLIFCMPSVIYLCHVSCIHALFYIFMPYLIYIYAKLNIFMPWFIYLCQFQFMLQHYSFMLHQDFHFCCIVFSLLCCINKNICCIITTNVCCIKICQQF